MKKFVYIAFAGIMLFGCKSDELVFDDIQVPNVTGVYSFPLGEVRYTMRDLIDNIGDAELELEEDSATSVLTLFYRDTIAYTTTDDLVSIGEITQSVSFSNIPATPPVPADTTISITHRDTIFYNSLKGEELDSIFYETGDLEATVSSDIASSMSYTLTLVNTQNVTTNAPVVVSGAVMASSDTQTSSLVNHVTRLAAPDSNIFVLDFTTDINLQTGEQLSGTESIDIDVTFRNQTFQTVFGKFGQDTIQVGNQAIDIEFFREMGEEGIFFGNPMMRFDFQNSFGIPMSIGMGGMFGDDGNGGTQTFLGGDIVDNPPRIEGSDVNNPGNVAESDFEITKSNSTIVDLLSTSPGRLVFDIRAITNPLDATQVNYLQPTSSINTFVEMEIPMEIRLEDLEQSGTLSLGGGIDVSSVDSVFMRITTLNELPFSGLLSLEIQDADSNALYSVANNLVIKAPFININGFVTDPGGATSDVPFSRAGLDALKEGSHVLFTVTLNTPESVTSRDIFVKLLADYAIDIKIGLGGKLNVKL